MTKKHAQKQSQIARPAGYNFDYDGVVFGVQFSAPPIKTLLDNPDRFHGKSVRIKGEVEPPAEAFVGAYHVTDGTGTLMVQSHNSRAPRDGATVCVEGSLDGTVLVEQRRYI